MYLIIKRNGHLGKGASYKIHTAFLTLCDKGELQACNLPGFVNTPALIFQRCY